MDIYEIRRINLIKLIEEKCNGSDASFARAIDKDASYITRCKYPEGKAGKKRISDAIISAIMSKYSIPAGWMDSLHDDNYQHGATNRLISESVIESYSNSVPIPLLAATASMGNGNESHDADLVIDVLRITKQWADRTLSVSKINNLRFIHAIGDSMHPTFNDGDILLVDTGAIAVKNDSVYVLEAHERLFIKRVRQRLDGSFEISSDNPAVKTVDILNGDHQVTVKGKVVWVWNGKRV